MVEIAKKARLQRSTAYLIASEMVDQGLVTEDHKAYKKLFIAAEPEFLLRKLETKYRKLGRSALALKEVIPELQAAHQATTTRPRVRAYEGKAGLHAVLKDILEQQQEILLWTNQQAERQFFDAQTHELFIKQRISKQIPLRALVVDNPEGRDLLTSNNTNFRQTRLLPNTMHFTCETYIYGDKVAVIDIGKVIFGVITENKQIAQMHRSIFEAVWNEKV